MRKKKILILFILFMIGCTARKEFSPDFHKGIDGLKLNFLENAPPNEILFIKDNLFLIGIGLKNEGAEDIKKGMIKVTSFKNYIDIKGGVECRFMKKLQNGIQCNIPRLNGKSFEVVEGEFFPLYLDAEVINAESGVLESLDTIEAEAEYEYGTTASIEICVNDVTDIFDLKKSCKAKPLILTGQGAPVTVAKVDYTASKISEKKNRLDLIITFEDKGAKEDKIVNEMIELEEISFSDYSTKTDGDKKITCLIKDDKIRVKKNKKENENMITCRASLNKEPAYLTPLIIKFNYLYHTKESKVIKIKRILLELEEELKKEKELKPEPFAPPVAVYPEDIKKMIAERLNKNKPFGDFRNFKIQKKEFSYLRNPTKEEINSFIEGHLKNKIKNEKAIEKLKRCYYTILQRESSYRQFEKETDEYLVLLASNIPGKFSSGCCVGLAQIYVREHLDTEIKDKELREEEKLDRAAEWILNPEKNMQKGLDIFLDCINKNKNTNLLETIRCYTGSFGNYDNPIRSSECPTLEKDEVWWKQ